MFGPTMNRISFSSSVILLNTTSGSGWTLNIVKTKGKYYIRNLDVYIWNYVM